MALLFLLFAVAMQLVPCAAARGGPGGEGGGRDTSSSSHGSSSAIRKGAGVAGLTTHSRPTRRNCHANARSDMVSFGCKSQNETEMEDKIDFMIHIKDESLCIKVKYNQDMNETETEAQFDVCLDSIIEYRKTTVDEGEAYDWENDEVLQTLNLTKWTTFSNITTNEEGVSSFSATTPNHFVTVTFAMSPTGNRERLTPNRIKFDVRIVNFPWQASDTYIALLTHIKSKLKVLMEENDNEGSDEDPDNDQEDTDEDHDNEVTIQRTTIFPQNAKEPKDVVKGMAEENDEKDSDEDFDIDDDDADEDSDIDEEDSDEDPHTDEDDADEDPDTDEENSDEDSDIDEDDSDEDSDIDEEDSDEDPDMETAIQQTTRFPKKGKEQKDVEKSKLNVMTEENDEDDSDEDPDIDEEDSDEDPDIDEENSDEDPGNEMAIQQTTRFPKKAKEPKDVKISFANVTDTASNSPFGEFTWAETARANPVAFETFDNATAVTIQVIATSPPVDEERNLAGKQAQLIAFSFVGDTARLAPDIFWDPEAGVGYSISGVGCLALFLSSAAAALVSTLLLFT